MPPSPAWYCHALRVRARRVYEVKSVHMAHSVETIGVPNSPWCVWSHTARDHVNIGSTLAAHIPTSGPSFKRYLLEANTECIFLTPTDAHEIRKFILDTRNSAQGHDEIPSKVIKPIIDILTTPLTYITNLSFTEGVFPSELKIAQVLPLYKSNDPMLFNNYRPISFLPYISNYLSGSCIIYWSISSKNTSSFISINSVFVGTILHSWL